MTDNLLTAPIPGTAAGLRPPQVPEKFWDAQAGTIRVDALLKSYLELERKLSASPAASAAEAAPPDRAQLLKLLGVPDHPDGYQIAFNHGMFTADPAINQRLHATGYTPEQAQLLYDLAAERFVPMVHQIAADYEGERQLQRLVEHFGGADKWREASRQLQAWGKKNLPPEALDGLSTTADGILALQRLMAAGEPVTVRANSAATGTGEADLHALMKDPRYWRDRNPEIVAKVTDGFRQLYPDQQR